MGVQVKRLPTCILYLVLNGINPVENGKNLKFMNHFNLSNEGRQFTRTSGQLEQLTYLLIVVLSGIT